MSFRNSEDQNRLSEELKKEILEKERRKFKPVTGLGMVLAGIQIAKRNEFASLRRKTLGVRFAFASQFISKKNSLSLRFRNRLLAEIWTPGSSTDFFKFKAIITDPTRQKDMEDQEVPSKRKKLKCC